MAVVTVEGKKDPIKLAIGMFGIAPDLLNTPVDEAIVAQSSAMVDTDKPFATAATLIAAAALPLATDPLAALVGGMQQLSHDVFAL